MIMVLYVQSWQTRYAMKVSKENSSDELYDVYQKYSQDCIY